MSKKPSSPAQKFQSLLKENRVFKPAKEFARRAVVQSMAQYKKLWTESVKNPERFWAKQANAELVWMKPFNKVPSGRSPSPSGSWADDSMWRPTVWIDGSTPMSPTGRH